MGNKTPRVLHVLDHLTPASGVASVVMNCVTGITKIRQDLAIYGKCDPDMCRAVEICGGKVYKLPDVTTTFGKPFSSAFAKLLKEQQYSVIHGHLLNSAFMYLRIAKKLGIPHRIIHAHNPVSADSTAKKIRNDILALGLPFWANKYIAVSEATAINIFGKMIKTVPDISIIQNGIDSSRFRFDPDSRKEVRQELCLSDDVLCVGHIGRFAKQKNHSFLLDVFDKMRKKANCVLILVGDGPLEDLIKEKAQAMGMSERIKFLGKRNDTEHLYQSFDVFLLPSLFEGFGLVAVEAQCAGLGCLVSDCVPRIVECSNNIHFLSLENAELWADTALNMATMLRTDGSTAIKSANLDISTMCDNVLKFYEQF